MTRENLELISNLYSRGFAIVDNSKMVYKSGSISNFVKCEIFILSPIFNEFSDRPFYNVSYESFSECGEVSDHHTTEKKYIHESELMEYLKGKGFKSEEERERERTERKNRLKARRG